MQIHPVSIVWQCPLDVSAYLALGQQIAGTRHRRWARQARNEPGHRRTSAESYLISVPAVSQGDRVPTLLASGSVCWRL